MFIISRNSVIVALTILMLASPLMAQQTPAATKPKAPVQSIAELESQAAQAAQDENWVRMYSVSMKLHKQRPFTSEYMLNIVLASARLGQTQTALHFMMKMQQQGLSYDISSFDGTDPIHDTEAYEYINNLMIKAGDPVGEGTHVLTLDVEPGDLGDLAWDKSRECFLVGTRSEGKLLAVDDNGQSEVLLQANDENGLWSINGITVDLERQRLWIASSATPAFASFTAGDKNHSSLFEFKLDTLELVGRYNLPVDGLVHELGSIALTQAGDVYVVDRAVPIIFRKTADGDKLEAFAGGPQLLALTDIAVTPDNSRIFVSDVVLGILLIDPEARRSAMLSGPETLNLSGIYGIEYEDGNVIVTQSGLSPQRLMRLKISANGADVETVLPMASSLDGFDTPGAGTLRDGNIYYFANHGSASADKLLLMKTPLTAGVESKPPDVRQFEEALRKASQQ